MYRALVLLILGVVIVAGAIAGNVSQRRLRESRADDIRRLRLELDSTRAAMAVAPGATDSARLEASIGDRKRLLARREGHLGSQPTVESWWPFSGTGTFAVTAGVALIALAAVLFRRESRTST